MAGLYDSRRSLTSPLYRNALADALGAGRTLPTQQTTKRKVFFSFHYDDIMRVNNVRKAWQIDHPDSQLMRSFYDSSLWESKQLEGDEALKRLIRENVEYTSAVCVLVGSQTWSRRWVKYEIARSVIDGRGLLAAHLNNINHDQRRTTDTLGFNPLELLGVYRSTSGEFFLYEKQVVVVNQLTSAMEWQWHPYADYRQTVSLPRYLSAPSPGCLMPLSTGTRIHDFGLNEGHKNLGAWIDHAAQAVGR